MTDPLINEKHKLLREQVRSFAESEINPLAAELDEKLEFSQDISSKMFDMGLLRINLPESYGSMGMAKLYTSEIAREVVNEALQIHDAHGLMKGNDIERFYRDQRILEIGEGTSEILRMVIARHLGI